MVLPSSKLMASRLGAEDRSRAALGSAESDAICMAKASSLQIVSRPQRSLVELTVLE
jgi:hypothetical protein